MPSSFHHLLPILCRLGGQQALHRDAGGVQRVGAQVGVDVRRGGIVGVAQEELGLLHGDAAGHQEAGAGVPKLVEAENRLILVGAENGICYNANRLWFCHSLSLRGREELLWREKVESIFQS